VYGLVRQPFGAIVPAKGDARLTTYAEAIIKRLGRLGLEAVMTPTLFAPLLGLVALLAEGMRLRGLRSGPRDL